MYDKKKILILGAGGMLGHVLFMKMSKCPGFDVYGTVRKINKIKCVLNGDPSLKVIDGVDAYDMDTIKGSMKEIKPGVVINCIGIIKQLPESNDPVTAISINALLPHKLAALCLEQNTRLIHFSTDCVYDGKKGRYTEKDAFTAKDLYGITKYAGEVSGKKCLTIRTSVIGHELGTRFGLIEWFLSQQKRVKGYSKAIYSGFPTAETADVLIKYVIPNEGIEGLYHLSSEPISKYELLKLIAKKYNKSIEIVPSAEVDEDRSLDSSRFRNISGYIPPKWDRLVDLMYDHYKNSPCYNKSTG